LEEVYLVEWRAFIKRIKQSKPLEDLWNECTTQLFGKLIMLQKDTPTRWSSTVMMLKKAFFVRLAVERMRIVTAGTEHQVFFMLFVFFFFCFNSISFFHVNLLFLGVCSKLGCTYRTSMDHSWADCRII
jgi:hypothetical protein